MEVGTIVDTIHLVGPKRRLSVIPDAAHTHVQKGTATTLGMMDVTNSDLRAGEEGYAPSSGSRLGLNGSRPGTGLPLITDPGDPALSSIHREE